MFRLSLSRYLFWLGIVEFIDSIVTLVQKDEKLALVIFSLVVVPLAFLLDYAAKKRAKETTNYFLHVFEPTTLLHLMGALATNRLIYVVLRKVPILVICLSLLLLFVSALLYRMSLPIAEPKPSNPK